MEKLDPHRELDLEKHEGDRPVNVYHHLRPSSDAAPTDVAAEESSLDKK